MLQCINVVFSVLQLMHPKLLLDADVLYMRRCTVAKMYVEQVETRGCMEAEGCSPMTSNL